MKKIILIFILLLIEYQLCGQSYEIGFSGSGASSLVDSVKVQNLTQNTFVSLGGNDILVLDLIVGEMETSVTSNGLYIFPNPFSSSCYLEFDVTGSSQVTIEVLNVSGRVVLKSNYSLNKGYQRFKVENLLQGLYFAKVFSEDFHYSGKIISLYTGDGSPKMFIDGGSIKKKVVATNISDLSVPKEETSKTFSYVHMTYYAGERLLVIGKSGIFSTVISFIPNHTQTLDFIFVPCTDADGNHYPVVHIGSQTWMAANLKTTHYRNADSITLVTDGEQWMYLTTDAYCNYNNVPDSAETYGRLYNFQSVKDNRKIAPEGWRIPDTSDAVQLISFLGGANAAGGKLKETGLAHWLSPNAGATNETGFTALPGGFRSSGYDGEYRNIGKSEFFWTSNMENDSYSYYCLLSFGSSSLYVGPQHNNSGLSVRCLWGERPTVTTDSVTGISGSGGLAYGTVISEGSSPVTERGFFWVLSNGSPVIPSMASGHAVCGSGQGIFTENVSGLMSSNNYHIMAYATNAFGTSYGEILDLPTASGPPFITLLPINNITGYSATSGGSIDTTGGFVSDMHGVCWCLYPGTPSLSNSKTTDGPGTGSYVSQLTGLQPGKTYNVRAYSTNVCGTVYGGYETFTTNALLPTVTTSAVTGLTVPTAVSGGNVTNDGGSPILERGVCWCNTNCTPVITGNHTSDGTGTGTFTSSIPTSNLAHYYVRAYARNSVGVAYGEVVEFDAVVQLGQIYQGGKVGYLNYNSEHGYIVSLYTYQAEWGCYGGNVTTSYDFGSGPSNTIAIVNACSTPGIAARVCNDLVQNGYDDWYLPSRNELYQLYENKDVIGGFDPLYYWSSSQCNEYPCSSNDAVAVSFVDGNYLGGAKWTVLRFRPVRAF